MAGENADWTIYLIVVKLGSNKILFTFKNVVTNFAQLQYDDVMEHPTTWITFIPD